MASRLLYIPKTYPFAFGIGFSCAKTSVSDLLVQLGVEQKRLQDVDWRRNAAFATFGFFYLGGVQYTIYVPIFGRMFPNTVAFAAKPIAEKLKDPMGFAAVGAQVFLDQCARSRHNAPCPPRARRFMYRGVARGTCPRLGFTASLFGVGR